MTDPGPDRTVMVLRSVVAAIAALTIIGLIWLWPRGDAPKIEATAADLTLVEATVTDVTDIDCIDSLEQFEVECQRVDVEITHGEGKGTKAMFLKSMIDMRSPTFDVGDTVVLSHNPMAPPDYRYAFFEFQRSVPLLLLGLLFAVVVIAFGRWKGVRALLGLAISLAVIIGFLLPALLRDRPAVAVALVTMSLIAFAALYITHGVTMTTTVALIGTLAAVVLITVMAAVVNAVAQLTGLADESLQVLAVTADSIDPRGILLAGMVIGALGVLDDVTVTQVSAVAELHKADPHMANRELYSSAIRIGRDHVASAVNTLVLAYVGATLALMLYFYQEGRSFGQVLSQEIVAVEIARMLVGSIGLVLAVPITTALAVRVARSVELEATHTHGPIDHGHSHDHGGHGNPDRGETDDEYGDDQGDRPDPAPRRKPSWDDFAPDH